MIQARRIQIPGVEIKLTPTDSISLEHMLDMYILSAGAGEYGHGTSIDDDIKLATAIKDALHSARPKELQ